jgi:hypothetical protein
MLPAARGRVPAPPPPLVACLDTTRTLLQEKKAAEAFKLTGEGNVARLQVRGALLLLRQRCVIMLLAPPQEIAPKTQQKLESAIAARAAAFDTLRTAAAALAVSPSS